jgi:putative membrane protein
MTTPRDPVLFQAEFDPKWKTYFFLKDLLIMIATIGGIVLVPFWVLGLGQWYCKRYFENLRCTLCERSLVVARGIYFKRERTIPLDKIQDLTLLEGPLLKRFGLSQLKVETAGQSSAQQGGSEADLVGIVEARKLRDRVLDQRDAIIGAVSAPTPAAQPAAERPRDENVLVEIRDSLGRIEKLLADGRES